MKSSSSESRTSQTRMSRERLNERKKRVKNWRDEVVWEKHDPQSLLPLFSPALLFHAHRRHKHTASHSGLLLASVLDNPDRLCETCSNTPPGPRPAARVLGRNSDTCTQLGKERERRTPSASPQECRPRAPRQDRPPATSIKLHHTRPVTQFLQTQTCILQCWWRRWGWTKGGNGT